MRERNYLEDLSVEGKIILKWFLRKWDVSVWNSLVGLRDGHQLQAAVNTVMNFRVPRIVGNFFTS